MISVKLKPSFILAGLLAVAHSGAILLAFRISWLLVLPLLFSMAYSIMHHALLSMPGSIVSAEIGEKSGRLRFRNGTEKEVFFLGGTYVSPYVTVLNMKEEGSVLSISAVILPDSVDLETFRTLRVWLKWKVTSFSSSHRPDDRHGRIRFPAFRR